MQLNTENMKSILIESALCIKTIDMHTGGEPLRVIVAGYPEIRGENVLEKRNYCKTELDHLRKFLMFEPRGHADMYGCLIVEPNDEGADFGVIFMHNEGYSTMCGHATIAIAKLAVQMGWVKRQMGETKVVIDAPCGRLKAFVDREMKVRFQNVPSFALYLEQSLELAGYGSLTYDIAYGGAFYGFFRAEQMGLSVAPENIPEFIKVTKILKKMINDQLAITHPFESDLSFLYGCIFIEDGQSEDIHSKNICVFADGEVDRSPTGSGVSARIAIHMDKGEVVLGEELTIESVIGSRFKVKAIEGLRFGNHNAYISEVAGEAFVTGRHEFIVEEGDLIKEGFLLR
jgi:trans-L-3-hydroxyproline dehydratase